MDVFTFKKKIEIITKFNLNTFEIYKTQGNDLYKEYNKKEKKAKTDDDLKLSKGNTSSMLIEANENGLTEEKNVNNSDEKLNNEIAINTNKINTTDDLKLTSKKLEQNDDIEMKDETLHLDKSDWVKAEFYNYSYSIPNGKGKNKSPKEERIAMPRIIYINKNWSNAQLYDCIIGMLEGTRPERT